MGVRERRTQIVVGVVVGRRDITQQEVVRKVEMADRQIIYLGAAAGARARPGVTQAQTDKVELVVQDFWYLGDHMDRRLIELEEVEGGQGTIRL